MAAPIIDWILAEWIAARLAGDMPAHTEIDLNALARDAQRRVVAYTGLVPDGPLPAVEGVSRTEWVRANISSSRAMIDPLVGRMADTLAGKRGIPLAASAVASTEVGLLIGYLGTRVLGQYELVLFDADHRPRELDPDQRPYEHGAGQEPRLLMVMPNLMRAIERFDADPLEFFTWVTLHEITHAVQFGSVPWLREHLAGLLGQMAQSAEVRLSRGRQLRIPDRSELARLARAARYGDLIGIVASESDRQILDRAQAVMAVIEGHAEHVMDAVAPDLIPSLPELRAKLSQRRKQQGLPGKLVSRALGMEMKMRQYEHGKAFCDAVVAGGGTDALHYLFSSSEALPSLAEIQAPGSWLRRVKPAL